MTDLGCTELLGSVSPELKARMQGISCSRFKTSEPVPFKEMAALKQNAFASYKESGFM